MMTVQIKNTADDRMKAHLHRTASKFIYEPSIGGIRLRLGTTMELTSEHFEQNREMLEGWEAKGMIEIILPEGPPSEQPKAEEPPPAPKMEETVDEDLPAETPADTQVMEGAPATLDTPSSEAPKKGPKKSKF